MGPQPSELGGVANVATLLLEGLIKHGASVDCYFAGAEERLPERLREQPRLTIAAETTKWSWDRWGAQPRVLAVATGLRARQRAQEKLISRLVEQHARQPYDVYYQFSQIELFGARSHRRRLPPIVIHPEVHAAGELRWLERERRLAAQCRPWRDRVWQRSLMRARALIQRRDIRHAHMIVAVSHRFGRHLAEDYGVPDDVVRHLPNPIDLTRYRVGRAPRRRKLRLVFVSRIAVRKGVDMIVALSRRLRDLASRVEIVVVGGPSPWSDYRGLLEGLEPSVARFMGEAYPTEMSTWMASADVLVQPSMYEPFALTVAEALASGVPVVVSEAVGAGEGVDPFCCRKFAVGDIDAMEREVRALIADIEAGQGPALAARARREASSRFDAAALSRRLLSYLEEAATRGSRQSGRT